MINRLLNRKRSYRTFKRAVPEFCECGFPLPVTPAPLRDALGKPPVYERWDHKCLGCKRINSWYA